MLPTNAEALGFFGPFFTYPGHFLALVAVVVGVPVVLVLLSTPVIVAPATSVPTATAAVRSAGRPQGASALEVAGNRRA